MASVFDRPDLAKLAEDKAPEYELAPQGGEDQMSIGTDKMLRLLNKLADSEQEVRMLKRQIRLLKEELAELRNTKSWQR